MFLTETSCSKYNSLAFSELTDLSEMSFIGYKEINGFKMEKYRTTFEMVNENGRFVKKYVTHTQRDNIEVIYRSN